VELDAEQVAILSRLAEGIIPPDEADQGASAVNAGTRLAEKVRAGVNSNLYVRGIETARTIARDTYRADVPGLSPEQVHGLLESVRNALPGFFKQLRMDVSALYLTDPDVWSRIGFPGPSTEAGGYPDFDRPQTMTIRVKERTVMGRQ
jgi:hypothetical protein